MPPRNHITMWVTGIGAVILLLAIGLDAVFELFGGDLILTQQAGPS